MRRSLSFLLPVVVLAVSSQPVVQAQTPVQHSPVGASRFDFALGYQYTRANAPPAECGCFQMNGGFASAQLPVWSWLSAAVEVTGGHAGNISPLGQDLTLTTFAAGPRVTFGNHRVTPYAQALLGAAHGGSSYFPQNGTYTTSSTSFAYTAGGGVDLNLSHRLAIRLVEAQYLHTGFPNGADNEQHHLTLGAGIVLKFGKEHGKLRSVPPPPPPPPPPAAATLTPPPPPPAKPVAPPTAAENTPAPSPSPASAPPSATVVSDVPPAPSVISDILFDFNSAELRPDAETSLAQATDLLTAHPDAMLLLTGYTDVRGPDPYNLALGKRRARNVQKALLHKGVQARRLKVLSHGKRDPVCSTSDESCLARNRRVSLTQQP